MKTIEQGDIYWANLDPAKGHEQSGQSPVLVLQKNNFNHFLNTIIVAPLTLSMQLRGRLTTYFLNTKKSGLRHDSMVLFYQVRTVDKRRLTKKAGKISSDDLTGILLRLMGMFW